MHPFAGQIVRVEFHVNRVTAGACVLTALALAVAWGYLAFAAPAPLHGIVDAAAMGAAIIGALLLLCAAFHIARRYVVTGGAIVAIDERGILDRRLSPYVLPWSHIRDIRLLDRHGYQVGIEIDPLTLMAPRRRSTAYRSATQSAGSGRVAIISTAFLQSAFRDRAMGFLMPLTAISPIDFNETPVSEATQRADEHRVLRQRRCAITFGVLAFVMPAVANLYRFVA
ncbi:MAG: hypothetical protein MJE12_20730 [Alphaproteobacteria bacterium]|nr:hypothetical protein [Alphaproteobacteria bacterium]